MLLLKYPLEWADFLPSGLIPRATQSVLPGPPDKHSLITLEA
ncbi:hypothetical protein [Prochlorococcus marinus]|nr:hypothetical protein [Prochlorococcus marinus]